MTNQATGTPVGDRALGDRALWDRASGGDEAAFGELFERHAEAVWNHAYRLTGSWAAAEDLTSHTFLIAWRRRADVALVRDSALPWLYTVAGNAARDEHRGAKRRLRLLRKIPDAPVVSDHADAVAERLDGERRLREVVAAVRTLPKAQREVVELCLLGDLSAADAAALLSVAEVTVRAHLSRARARLRTLLEEK
ncbi:RNA polymerase sigma factor [Amycolatopsis vancoresmycina]|uniref:ECF subfamily RNA polymerase sigma-70 factor n=1 Tax=Amycolatopsis vancoresmycina DSM 44592 TaxID=1292037 RepID=R1I9P2_9PSEU|nr:RNA polymerase sigma factor [Amycolatopsis vancoresmycina]EOD69271.1 ECF subfamily RNA polymerase sigma-70 factor [Amycolatopsis vancoresmycina DSM 44592]